MTRLTTETFTRDVLTHQMTAIRDDGFYRHLRFGKPDSSDMRFDGDPSVGIEYGPEEVWAVTMAGASFDLTDEEVEKFTIEAAKRYHEDDDYGLDEL